MEEEQESFDEQRGEVILKVIQTPSQTPFKTRNVSLWEKHGATATAPDVMKAWDFLDVSNKGAKLLLTCWAAGFKPAGLSNEQLTELEQFI